MIELLIVVTEKQTHLYHFTIGSISRIEWSKVENNKFVKSFPVK